jgi:hypothetical protein
MKAVGLVAGFAGLRAMLAPVIGEPGRVAPLSAPASDQARRRTEVADLLMAAVFAMILIVQISNHEMWRDEIHSWGLVLASPSLSELYANLRFTGHPGLWYLPLWAASWFTQSVYTIQVVHAAIAVLLIATIAIASPFSRLEKLLLLLSYFVLYEYTVVSRNYGLGFLIALTYAHMRSTRPDRLYVNAVLLGLLANTNLSAFLLSGILALEYLIELLLRSRRPFWVAAKAILPAAALYLALAALAVATMWPSPDISWRTTGLPLGNASDVARLLGMIAGNVEALVPTHPLAHWDAEALERISLYQIAVFPILVAVLFFIFRENLQLLAVLLLTFLGSTAIGQLVYAKSIRHWGICFIAFVVVLWIQRIWNPQRSYLVLGLLAINALAGIAVSVQQFPRVFSEGEATAEWIERNAPENFALVGTPDTSVSVVAQFLGKPIYFLECSCTDTYLVFHRRRDDFDQTQIPDRLAGALKELGDRPVLFLVTRRLQDADMAAMQDRGVVLTFMQGFDSASTDENFFVYRAVDAVAGNPQLSSLRGAFSEFRQ